MANESTTPRKQHKVVYGVQPTDLVDDDGKPVTIWTRVGVACLNKNSFKLRLNYLPATPEIELMQSNGKCRRACSVRLMRCAAPCSTKYFASSKPGSPGLNSEPSPGK